MSETFDTSNLDGYVPEWITQTIPEDLRNTLFKVKVALRAKDDESDELSKPKVKMIALDILPLIGIQYETAEKDLETTPSQLIFVAALYSEIRNQVSTIERAIKTKRAVLTKTTLDLQKQEGVRLTNDQIMQIVNADAEIIKLEDALAKKQMQAGKLYYYIEGLRMKNENLRSLVSMKKSGI